MGPEILLPVLATTAIGSSLLSGFSQASALKSQAKEAEYNARNADLQASQASAERRKQLNESFAAIDAIRAQRNVASGSPTDMAIRQDFRKRSYEAEDAEQLGIRIGAVGMRTRAAEARRAAPFAVIAGIGQAAQTGYSLAG